MENEEHTEEQRDKGPENYVDEPEEAEDLEQEDFDEKTENVEDVIKYLQANFGDHPMYHNYDVNEEEGETDSTITFDMQPVDERMWNFVMAPERESKTVEQCDKFKFPQSEIKIIEQKEIGFVDVADKFYFFEENGNTFKDTEDNLYILDDDKQGYFDKHGHHFNFDDAGLLNSECQCKLTENAIATTVRQLLEQWLTVEVQNDQLPIPKVPIRWKVSRFKRKYILLQSYFDCTLDEEQINLLKKKREAKKKQKISTTIESNENDDDESELDEFSKFLLNVLEQGSKNETGNSISSALVNNRSPKFSPPNVKSTKAASGKDSKGFASPINTDKVKCTKSGLIDKNSPSESSSQNLGVKNCDVLNDTVSSFNMQHHEAESATKKTDTKVAAFLADLEKNFGDKLSDEDVDYFLQQLHIEDSNKVQVTKDQAVMKMPKTKKDQSESSRLGIQEKSNEMQVSGKARYVKRAKQKKIQSNSSKSTMELSRRGSSHRVRRSRKYWFREIKSKNVSSSRLNRPIGSPFTKNQQEQIENMASSKNLKRSFKLPSTLTQRQKSSSKIVNSKSINVPAGLSSNEASEQVKTIQVLTKKFESKEVEFSKEKASKEQNENDVDEKEKSDSN